MTGAERWRVGVDATPLVTGHAIRGIGRYLRGVLDAASMAEPEWTRTHIALLLLNGQPAPIEAATWRTRRAPIRPQDLDPIVSFVADRIALRRRRPQLWHHTDPTNPWSPLRPDRTVVTVYDLIPLREPAVMTSIRAHRRFLYRRYLELVRRAAGIIAISESTAADVVELLGVPEGRIRIVPPYVGASIVSDSAADDSIAGPPAKFLFVGIPESHKRPMLAIDAFGELIRRGVDAELAFAGLHPASLRMALRERVAAAGVEARVRYLDRIDDAELGRRYAESVLVATSSIEGFGLPLVEAILAGGRVAATATAAYRDAVGAVATFATDSSVGAVADAMAGALGRAPSVADRARLAQRFGAPAVAAGLLAAYRDLVNV
jgi:glycosyltransferase involved in cell wall biosynthesis